MNNIKLFYKRFEDVDAGKIYMEVEMRTTNVKKEAEGVISVLNEMEGEVTNVIATLSNLPATGVPAVNKLKNVLSSLMETSKNLNIKMGNIGKQKNVTPDFANAKNNLKNKLTLKENQIGFTGGTSDDPKQLLKEVNYVYDAIMSKIKLIKNEENARIKGVETELANAQKLVDIENKQAEAAERAAQAQQRAAEKAEVATEKAKMQQAAQASFQASYTDLGNNEATQSFRNEYAAIMQLLPAEQREQVIKKLMAEENKKLVNSTFQEIQSLKEAKISSIETTSAFDKLRNAMARMEQASTTGKAKFKGFINELKSAAVTWRILSGVFGQIIGGFANLYDSAAAYEEALNLYTVALGEYAEEGTQWAERISSALYLSPKSIMQYTGALYNLVQGLGVGSDAAYKMATNLTQLSYDMSSYLNIDVESAYTKLQSAITGQSRAVASAGVAMQMASLQELAYRLGIKKTVNEMTQSEKTYLRYIQIMRSTANMQGDLARTIVTPENALRTIKTQFEMLGRAIGQVFIPIVLKVIPYIMVLTQKLKELAVWLAGLTGYKIADIDYSSLKDFNKTFNATVGNVSDGVGKTTKGVNSGIKSVKDNVKDLKDNVNSTLASFDDLNVVMTKNKGSDTPSSSTPGAGSGAGVGGGGVGDSILGDLEKFVDGYDMLDGLTDNFNKQLDQARKNLDKILEVAKVIGGVFLGWKLAKKFMKDYLLVSDFMKNAKPIKEIISNPAVSAVATIAGAILAVYLNFKSVNDETDRFKNAWKSGDWKEYFKIDSLDELIDKVRTFTFILQGGLPAAIAIAGAKLGWFSDIAKKLKDIFKDVKEKIIVYIDDIKNEFVDIYKKNLEPTIKDLKKLWDDAVTWIKKKYDDNIKPIIDNIQKNIMPKIKDLINIIKQITPVVGAVISGVRSFTSPFRNVFQGLTSAAASNISTFIGKIRDITGVVKGIVTAIKGIKNGSWKDVWNGLKTVAVNAFKLMTKPIAGAALGIVKVAEALVNAMRAAVRKIAEAINKLSIKIPNWVPIYGGKGWSPNLKAPQGDISLGSKTIEKYLRAKSGIDFVPKDYFGPVYLDYGERVLTKEENKDYMRGNVNYLQSLGTSSATSNNRQMMNELTNAIVEGISNIQNNNPGEFAVYLGNDLIYKGMAKYRQRENNRYGTTIA